MQSIKILENFNAQFCLLSHSHVLLDVIIIIEYITRNINVN